MRQLLFAFAALFMLLNSLPSTAVAESPTADQAEDGGLATDREAVRAAVLDYVEGLYEVAPERIERSVHPELAKIGWKRDPQGTYREHPLTYEQLVTAARRYNARGQVPADAPKDIVIYEVLDKTASVKLTADWGIDFMHLVKLDGKWLIRNVLWQGHPRE